jgi:hypothetical protein
MTQAERVLVLLAVRGPEGVSVLDFAPGFRLAARIADLRAAGNPIDTQTATLPGGAKVARHGPLADGHPADGARLAGADAPGPRADRGFVMRRVMNGGMAAAMVTS